MSSSLEDVRIAAPAQLTGTPVRVHSCLPAVPQIGTVAAVLFERLVRAWDVQAPMGAVAGAVGAVTDELAGRTTPWSMLEVSIERDDHDVYVRLATDVGGMAEPALSTPIDAVVSLATQSHDVGIEDGTLLVVLQASIG